MDNLFFFFFFVQYGSGIFSRKGHKTESLHFISYSFTSICKLIALFFFVLSSSLLLIPGFSLKFSLLQRRWIKLYFKKKIKHFFGSMLALGNLRVVVTTTLRFKVDEQMIVTLSRRDLRASLRAKGVQFLLCEINFQITLFKLNFYSVALNDFGGLFKINFQIIQ